MSAFYLSLYLSNWNVNIQINRQRCWWRKLHLVCLLYVFWFTIQFINLQAKCKNTLVPTYWVTFSRKYSSFLVLFSLESLKSSLSLLSACVCVCMCVWRKKFVSYFHDRIIFQLNQGIWLEPIANHLHTCCHPSLIRVVWASSIFFCHFDRPISLQQFSWPNKSDEVYHEKKIFPF